VRHVLLRDNDAVWHFVFASRPQNTATLSEAFRRTTYSFEKLTAQEAATARPFRIRVVRVGPNDTQETMARRMVVEDLPLRQFQVLNHLQPEDRLRPGQLVKIIAD
jgi:predicted Zn-dependent protease